MFPSLEQGKELMLFQQTEYDRDDAMCFLRVHHKIEKDYT